jgi:hypothetical protein
VVILQRRSPRYTLGKGLVGSESRLDGAASFVPKSMKFILIELPGMIMIMMMIVTIK